ncbi:MAG: NADH-quinone oxidoreductase subunit J [Pirellulales bacterium]
MDAINWHTFFFLLFSLVACAFAIAVVLSSNIVRMAFYLILSLAATSGLFFLAGADFVGAMQLMIYVGGTLVLLIFGVMLTNQGPYTMLKSRGDSWLLGVVAGVGLLALLTYTALGVRDWMGPTEEQLAETQLAFAQPSATATPIGNALLGIRVDKLNGGNEPDAQQQVLQGGMSGYLLPFEIVSVHLLVVLIGAAYLARTKKRSDTRST